jgi:signal transduction histidine kinase
MLQRMSLRTRFVLFALACLVPLLITVAFFLDRNLERNTDTLVTNQFAIASMADRTLTGYFDRNITSLERLGSNPDVIAMNADEATQLLGQAATVRPEFTSLFLVNADGALVSETNPPSGLAGQVSDQLTQTMTNRQVRLSPRIPVNDDTTVVVLTVPIVSVAETESAETSSDPSDQNALVTGEPVPEAESETTPPGQVVGAIAGVMRVDTLEQLVVPLVRGRTEMAVVRGDEVFLATAGILRDPAAFVEESRESIELAATGETGEFTANAADGARLTGVYQPMMMEGATWSILVTNPRPHSFTDTLWYEGLLALALSSSMILAIAVVLGELTARPLRILATKASAIKQGDFSARIEPIGVGEIRDLSSAMAEMTTQLEDQMHVLEESRGIRESQTRQMRDLLRRTLRLQEDEQRRIASEIHDAVSPLITGALYQARSLQMTNGSTPHEESVATLNSVNHLLEQASDELHGVIFDLRPPDLDDLGVVAAIRAYVGNIKHTNLTVRLDLDEEPPGLTSEVRLGMYRIVQEAIHNVMRHSGADDALVRLESTDELLRLTIRDNGSGFDPEMSVRPTSLGLLSMRERAAAIGATLTIVSKPGGGTAIILERPHTGSVMSDDVLADLMSAESARASEDGQIGDDQDLAEDAPTGETVHNTSSATIRAEGAP